MAKTFVHINIFVASPGDVVEERAAVVSVVQELNTLFRTTLGVCLDVVMWETHAYPSIGIDAQDVINKQIGDDYDIFIGLMWKRFGTETGRAGSGTEEEFDRAYELHKSSNGDTKVMMYFSEKKFSIDEVDVEQIVKIRNFKKKTNELGVMHWPFSSCENIEQLLRLHIPRHVKEILSHIDTQSGPANSMERNVKLDKNDSPIVGGVEKSNELEEHDELEESDDEDKLGYMDFIEIFHQKMGLLTNLMTKIKDDTEELGEKIGLRTSKVAALNKAKVHAPEEYKRIYAQVSNDSISYADANNKNANKFHSLSTDAINALSGALAIQREYVTKESIAEIEELLEEIIISQETINGVINNCQDFRYQIKILPSVSKVANKGNRILEASVVNIIKEFTNYVVLLSQVVIVLEEIIENVRKSDGSFAHVVEE